ncbi:efflux transporter periplasmic adaptor subunit [Niastella yeongjuensis]|uniref:Efflux transporter periplasmic adaptor subunit n=1 Tax=Niastella yeongjuensis TaxID=354355 RepID=A0A1V9EFD4_9BACT|nr:efflux RND transporter periplasmic adaptor subunit [Niastella yeongjuensis]OQP44830.1 efflux transporter periplasmic adaptor subunit [Niastella yeongjuensis]SEP42112.1 RND family efflux transporter, MFP subunit [Niastella yeongjuensis]
MFCNSWIQQKIAKAYIIPIVALLALAACSPGNDEKGKKKESTSGIPMPETFNTTPIRFINPGYELSLPAELEPNEEVSVYAKLPGFVQHLYVDRGDRVRKGQLLAILEAPEIEQKYMSNKSSGQKVYNDYLFARQNYERLAEASKTSGAVAAIELERAKSAMESTKAAYEASTSETEQTAQIQKYLRITAPFDGIITARNVSLGALAGTSSGMPLFLIEQKKKLRLTVSIPEKHASAVREGMTATFTISSQPGKIFKTKLSRSSGLLNQQNRSLVVEFDVDNASGDLQGRDYAQVTLQLKRKDPTYWIPVKSLLNTQSGVFVLTFNNQEIKRIPVKEGVRLDSLLEVFGNFGKNDNIVLKPSEEIKEGKYN